MIPGTKSIFTIGREDGGGERKSRSCSSQLVSSSTNGSGNLVGLRLIIDRSFQRPTTNIVPKSTLRTWSAAGARPGMSPELGFLKACFLCKKELSPSKDVYIYRGDQGFCSNECRCRQIFIDERKEFDASIRERSAAQPRYRPVPAVRVREGDHRRRVLVAAWN